MSPWSAWRCAAATRGGSVRGRRREIHSKLRDAFLAFARPSRSVASSSTATRRGKVAKQIWDAVQTRFDPASAPFQSRADALKSSRDAHMSPKANEAGEVRHPRETLLFDHGEAEAGLFCAYRSGRIPHAFLIAGPKGIGKATLAYRMARFVMAYPDPAVPREVGESLASPRTIRWRAGSPRKASPIFS